MNEHFAADGNIKGVSTWRGVYLEPEGPEAPLLKNNNNKNKISSKTTPFFKKI